MHSVRQSNSHNEKAAVSLCSHSLSKDLYYYDNYYNMTRKCHLSGFFGVFIPLAMAFLVVIRVAVMSVFGTFHTALKRITAVSDIIHYERGSVSITKL